jgi:ketosteroid isomerase-like protein
VSATATATESKASVEAFVEAFADNWRAPAGAAGLVESFLPLLHEDIRLVQPQIPDLVGYDQFRTGFAEPLFALMPDLRGEVEDWAARGDVVYIQVRLHGTLAGRPFEFRSCDRITLRDGRATERVAFMDPGPLVAAALIRPRAWPALARVQAASIRGRLRRGRRA